MNKDESIETIMEGQVISNITLPTVAPPGGNKPSQ